jgi:putative acetyltransferase
VLIRRETAADAPAVDEVHRRAFARAAAGLAGGDPVEVGLVRALRRDRGFVAALSLVAEDPGGRLVGHVMGTEGSVAATAVIGLGPLGVLPGDQGHGVGSALVHAVLAAADALDYPLVVLLGHTGYYPRFGFVPAASLGVAAPDPAWGDPFMVRPLAAYRPTLRGAFRYAAPFDAL